MTEEIQTLKTIVNNAINQLRPFLEQDGGDMELIEITEDKVVRVKLLGACRDCSMSMMTLKAGLEEEIKRIVPEILRVEAVDHSEEMF